MGIGLVLIQKEYNGEVWTNTHCFSTGAPLELDDSDLDEIGFPSLVVDMDVWSGGGAYTPTGAPFLAALLAFERKITLAPVSFTKMYITDGKQEDIADPNTFAVRSFNLPGLAPMGGVADTQLVPGSIALQINRSPFGYGNRQGRMQLRGCMIDGDVRFATRGGVDFTDAAVRAVYNTKLANVIEASGIGAYFGLVTEGVGYCIPHYAPKDAAPPLKYGQLVGATPIASLSVAGPVSRQMRKGKKKKVPA